MVQSLELGPNPASHRKPVRRLNRLPVAVGLTIVALVLGVVIAGLSWRGLVFDRDTGMEAAPANPATSFAEQLKRGAPDGIIGEPQISDTAVAPVPDAPVIRAAGPPPGEDARPKPQPVEPVEDWRTRLRREQDEQVSREVQRQRMARLQARAVALDSPLAVNIAALDEAQVGAAAGQVPTVSSPNPAAGLYAAAMRSGLREADTNGQAWKEDFLNTDIKELGYLPNKVVAAFSPFELKRGSVIPATLISGLNSDLPGRIIAQVSQNVFDSATGARLLIPQGAKLFGRYDAKISFGQERALVVWTDIIFPDGATLQIGAMAGSDAEGYGGFNDKVDRHLIRTFGAAALIAVIGAGIDMSMPDNEASGAGEGASDPARRSFSETFGRMAEQTIGRNLNVQPTIRIRPGYRFNVTVDQDIVFPSAYGDR